MITPNLTRLTLRDLPEEDGLDLNGELPASLFDDLPGGTVRATGPLAYSLHLLRGGDLATAAGRICAPFDLECVRCCGHFPWQAEIDPYLAELDFEESSTIDLTERLREDILLTLPDYPRCDHDGGARKCPVGDRFTATPPGPDGPGPTTSEPSQWDALESWESTEEPES